MSDPFDDTSLLIFIATLVGWTELHDEDTAHKDRFDPADGQTVCIQLCGRRPNGIHAHDIVPQYLDSVDDWLRDVWPKLNGSPNEWEWMDKLCKICGEDNMTRWANASARERCLALWRTLEGKQP